MAATAAENPPNVKFVLETPSEPRVKRAYTKREKPPASHLYGPTDPDRQGAAFRKERITKHRHRSRTAYIVAIQTSTNVSKSLREQPLHLPRSLWSLRRYESIHLLTSSNSVHDRPSQLSPMADRDTKLTIIPSELLCLPLEIRDQIHHEKLQIVAFGHLPGDSH